ncbi:MAG: amidohydrolase family protein [Sphingomonadales bacterium]
MMLRRALLTGAGALLLLSAHASIAQRAVDSGDRPVMVRDVNLITMVGKPRVERHRDVTFQAGRIVAIAPSGRARRSDATIIDGRGKYLMPGLADMHVHVEDATLFARATGKVLPEDMVRTGDIMLPYVANGVLQIFNLSASPPSLRQRKEIESGAVLGPHMATAVMIDGNPPLRPFLSTVAATPEQGRRIVREAIAVGYDAIKIYSNVDLDTFRAIVDEARKSHTPVLGHLPLRRQGRTAELLIPGFSMVAHAEEYGYQRATISVDDIPQYLALAKRTHTWLISTASIGRRIVEATATPDKIKTRSELKYTHPFTVMNWTYNNEYARTRERLPNRQQMIGFNTALLRAFFAAGVPVVAGSDTLVAGVSAGFGLHDELEELASIGIPSAQILASATISPARYLGLERDRGTIARGRRADMLLLDADPLADVANTRRIAAVILGGKVHTRAELDASMAALAARYAQMKFAPVGIQTEYKFGHDDD